MQFYVQIACSFFIFNNILKHCFQEILSLRYKADFSIVLECFSVLK